MAYRTEFKDAQDRALYIKKLMKSLAKRGQYYDIDDGNTGLTYEVGINTDGNKLYVKTASGEELELAWSSGSISNVWSFVLDKVIKDIVAELQTQPSLGVVINGKTYPVIKA